jgi:hypothetical protein
MANKVNFEVLNTIEQLIEILKELDNIDTLGNGISLQIKILNKIETLLDDL